MADSGMTFALTGEDRAMRRVGSSPEQSTDSSRRTISVVTLHLPDPLSLPPLPESPVDVSPAFDVGADGQQLDEGEREELELENAAESRDPQQRPAEEVLSPDRDSTGLAPSESESEHLPPMEDTFSKRSRSESAVTQTSAYSSGVDWEELEKSEEQEFRDEASDESTALLLARLEQENDALATDPKSKLVSVHRQRSTRLRRQSRPPSIHYLKSLVERPAPPSLRYSLLPAPPPMTDLEFYAALVADYPRTAQCLPTILSKKIRSGIPPPLRGVVWVSISGARDQMLEDHFERLSGETSPYENLIGKDIGRSFPGVDMFRESSGEGQRKLGKVLKCFSLYDQGIGYCQGLGFLVGPLLMHMGEREAFCVLVRLMEHYDLRSCFLPDLSGLHLRIYQFRHLLTQQLPKLAAHLENLQVNPAYVSQWFLSFFAVTCPLPMLLRIYDVIFAEGASETLMRVALSLMRRNEAKILAYTEMDGVMQLLLSRGIWDAYNCNADDFVSDFVELTGAIARDGLLALETSFKEAQKDGAHAKLGSLPDLQAAASRFLGRFWAGSSSTTKSAALSPTTAISSRPTSFLHRSPSRQSVASTLNSCEAGSESGGSSLLTDATTLSRQLSGDGLQVKSTTGAISPTAQSARQGKAQERDLHGQIEDLLTALSEMQKSQAVLGRQLQREREEHERDGKAVQGLVKYLNETRSLTPAAKRDDPAVDGAEIASSALDGDSPEQLSQLLEAVEARFPVRNDSRRRPSPSQEDPQSELNRLKVVYEQGTSNSQHLTLRLAEQEKESTHLKDQLKEARSRIQESHKERQRLESTLQELRVRRPSLQPCAHCLASSKTGPEASSRRSSTYAGLREFKLNKAPTMPVQPKRTSSLSTQVISAADNSAPPTEEALLLELVNSKTAEAVAKQEAEELRSKLESLRKMLGASEIIPAVANSVPVSNQKAPGGGEGGPARNLFSSLMHSGPAVRADASHTASSSISATPSGGFWGGWGKRTNLTPGVPET